MLDPLELLPPLAFAAATLCALLSGFARKGRDLLRLFAALGIILGVLAALAQGWTLERLQTPVLAACAASLLALRFGRGRGA